MYRYLYSTIFYLLIPVVLLRLLYRSIRAPAYRQRWSERFGFFQLPDNWRRQERVIWIHAVSVGETLAAVPLVKLLKQKYPAARIVVTTMTPTGSERVQTLFGDSIFHVYLPYDLPGTMRRFLNRIEPTLLIIMETELWPNLLHGCQSAGCRSILVNARLSEKSARGYQRIGKLTRTMLSQVNIIAAQATADVDRFIRLGADPDKISAIGSLKFDIDPPGNQHSLPAVFQQVSSMQRPVLIAASTREGEDEKVLEAFQQCLVQEPRLLLILVPRHPERFDSVARLCEQQGLTLERRSSDELNNEALQVWLGDSMGEMWNYYRLADLAFVGGSLVDTGCHNVLEPAALGIPVLAGPSQFNFATICNLLQEGGALITVADQHDLAQQVLQLLTNTQWRRSMGQAGRHIVENNRGCLQRLEELIAEQLAISPELP